MAYLDNLTVVHVDLMGVVTPLIQDVHYYVVLPFIGATRSIGKMLYGGLSVNDEQLEGNILVSYQTLGGDWVADASYVRQVLAEMVYNPKLTVWDQVTNVQEVFPPINHDQPLDTIFGMQALIDELARIRDAILAGPNADNGIIKHLTDTNNPHETDKDDVGLGLVQNLPVATDAEVNALDPENKYILLRQVLTLMNLSKKPPLLTAKDLFFSRRP